MRVRCEACQQERSVEKLEEFFPPWLRTHRSQASGLDYIGICTTCCGPKEDLIREEDWPDDGYRKTTRGPMGA